MKFDFVSGEMKETFNIPDNNLVSFFEPRKTIRPSENAKEIIKSALENPIGAKRLEDIIFPYSRIAIVTDDATRSTPIREIMDVLLPKLKHLGVKVKNITITVGNGLHKEPSDEEKASILGKEIINKMSVGSNNARDESCFTYCGTTSSGTPLFINRRVIEADLIITLGMIKTHSFAGFTGGAKSILPGVSSKETILKNHKFEFIEYPKGILGDADMSYARKDMEEAAGRLPVFMLNVVLNKEKRVLGAFAGDVVKAHRKGVEFFQSFAQVTVKELADVVVVEGGFPASENLYFALSGISGVLSTKRPIVKKGGTVIVMSHCREGIGEKIIEDLFLKYKSAERVIQHLKSNPPVEAQWAAQHLASYLSMVDVSLVTCGVPDYKLKALKIKSCKSVSQAIKDAFNRYGANMKVIVVKNADSLIANVE